MPRIGRFMAAHPDWTVNIDSSPALTDFARDDVDIAVRFGRGPWRGLHCERLMEDTYIMVASPSLNGGRLPKRPADLADWPMLRTDREPWDAWCAAAGVDLALPDRGVGYEDMGVMLQGAIDGDGVMLTRRAIAATELEKGTLRQLFDIAAPSDAAYWLVWPEDRAPSDRLLAFRDWIHAEAATPPAPARRQAAPERRGDGCAAGSRRRRRVLRRIVDGHQATRSLGRSLTRAKDRRRRRAGAAARRSCGPGTRYRSCPTRMLCST